MNNTHFMEYFKWRLPPNPSVKRHISVGAYDINVGEFKRFDETMDFDKFIWAVRASASIPLIFPTVLLEEMTLIDGGIYQNLDVAAAI